MTRRAADETSFRWLHSPRFFHRTPADLEPKLIRWPAEEEGWLDEVPAPIGVDSVCREFGRQALQAEDGEPVSYEDRTHQYVAAADAAAHLFAKLPLEGREGSLSMLHWRTRFYAAQVEHEVGTAWAEFARQTELAAQAGRDAEQNRERAAEAAAKADAHALSVRSRLAALIDTVPAGVTPAEAGRARLMYAMYELRNGKTAIALSMLASVRDADLDDDNFWTARYLELKVASDAARWSEAASLVDALPPRTSPLHGPYYYRVAVALRRTGAQDRFLQVAMKGFRDRPYKSDPFLRALYVEMLETLAEYPFEARIVEMLEDMGQRGSTYERLEEYARVALDRGRAENADAAAVWLLAHHTNARYHPRYHAIRALVAFLEDDPIRFRKRVREVIRRPDAVLEALPATRRPTFFAHADAELARILRQMLPVMAEWGDDERARDRRERWLKVIVYESQEFMRQSEDTLAAPQLVELYRLASGLLADHPRGYAERVGEEEPAPLVLGTVRVEGRDLERHEPFATLRLPQPFSLTLVPRGDARPAEWAFFWDVEAR